MPISARSSTTACAHSSSTRTTGPTSFPDQQLAGADPFLPPALAKSSSTAWGRSATRDPARFSATTSRVGATPLVGSLEEIRKFLEANSDRGRDAIIQGRDHHAGNCRRVSRGRPSIRTSTASTRPSVADAPHTDPRQSAARRFAEEAGPPPPWYNQAFENMQETPSFSAVPPISRARATAVPATRPCSY